MNKLILILAIALSACGGSDPCQPVAEATADYVRALQTGNAIQIQQAYARVVAAQECLKK